MPFENDQITPKRTFTGKDEEEVVSVLNPIEHAINKIISLLKQLVAK